MPRRRYSDVMLVINRFRVPSGQRDRFRSDAAAAMALLQAKPGCRELDLVQNLDEPDLWALVSRWDRVGDYRRALSGLESRMVIVPLLSCAIDEPSAYDEQADVNLPRGEG